MLKQLIVLSLSLAIKANAFTLPEHLIVIPLAHASSEIMDITENLQDIHIPDHFRITFQLHKDFEGSCKEIGIRDSYKHLSVFEVCVPDDE